MPNSKPLTSTTTTTSRVVPHHQLNPPSRWKSPPSTTSAVPLPPTAPQPAGISPRLVHHSQDDGGDDTDDGHATGMLAFSVLGTTTFSSCFIGDGREEDGSGEHNADADGDDADDNEPTSFCELSVAEGMPLVASKPSPPHHPSIGKGGAGGGGSVSFRIQQQTSPIKRTTTGRFAPLHATASAPVGDELMTQSTHHVSLVHRLQSSRGAFVSANLPNLSINNVVRSGSEKSPFKHRSNSVDVLGSLDLDNPVPRLGSSTIGGGRTSTGLEKVHSGSELFCSESGSVAGDEDDDNDGDDAAMVEQIPAAHALILNSPNQSTVFTASKPAEMSFELPSFVTNASLGLSFSSIVPPQAPTTAPPNLRSPNAPGKSFLANAPPPNSFRVMIPISANGAQIISPRTANQNQIANARTPQKQRHLEQHKQRLEGSHMKLDASIARQQQALERRQFLSDHQNLRQGASWAVMLCLAARTHRFLHRARVLAAQKRRMIKMGGRFVFPIVMVGVRRALRRARTKLLSHHHHYEKPLLSTLKMDKILGLFPDHVLRAAASSTTLKYFFPNEAIVFMGCEDDEAYVLTYGTADVMMGATKVFTMQPGMVFGTIGMISGEPRSASIFARGEGCLAWVMKRAVFDAAGDSAATAAAHDALAEVRQKNIMNVYKARLEPAALSSFPLFKGLSDDILRGLLSAATSRVVRRGTVLAEPAQPMSAVPHVLLLKGRVALTYQVPPPRLTHSDNTFDTVGDLRNAVDIPHRLVPKHLAALLDTRRTDKTNRLAQEQVLEISAPALLNVNSLFLPGGMMRPAPFVITAVTDCDLLSLSRKTLRSQDVLELASIQQNALNAHGDFLGAPTKRDVARMLLDSIAPLFAVMPSAQNILATLRASTATDSILGAFTIEKWVYPRGGYLCFERSSEFLINIVVEGELEGPSPSLSSCTSDAVTVWPQVADAWFAARDAVLRTTKRTTCLRVHRHDMIAWVCRALVDTQDLRTVCMVFANSIVQRAGMFSFHALSFSHLRLETPLWPLDVSLPYALVKVGAPQSTTGGGLRSPKAQRDSIVFRPGSGASQRKPSATSTSGSSHGGSSGTTAQDILTPIVEGVVQQLKVNTSAPHVLTSTSNTTVELTPKATRKSSPILAMSTSALVSPQRQVSPPNDLTRIRAKAVGLQDEPLLPTSSAKLASPPSGVPRNRSSPSPSPARGRLPPSRHHQQQQSNAPALSHSFDSSPAFASLRAARSLEPSISTVSSIPPRSQRSSSHNAKGNNKITVTKQSSEVASFEDLLLVDDSTRVYYRPVQLAVSLDSLRGKLKPSNCSPAKGPRGQQK